MEVCLYEISISVIGNDTISERDIRQIVAAIRSLPLAEMVASVLSSNGVDMKRVRIEVGGK